MATTLDIAPTLLAMAGLEEPEGMQGMPLTAVLQGTQENPRPVVLTENDDDFVPVRMRTITTSRWKLTYYLHQAMGELIDRENDPQEMVNLWRHEDYQALKQDLLALLLDMTLSSIDMANGRRQAPAPAVPKWITRPFRKSATIPQRDNNENENEESQS